MVSVVQEALCNTTRYGELASYATSFFLQLYSRYKTDPLFIYHLGAPALSNSTEGVASVDSDTIYRIGGIPKLFTVYMYCT